MVQTDKNIFKYSRRDFLQYFGPGAKGLLFMVVLHALLAGCMKDNELWKPGDAGQGDATQGVFVVNQGNFMYGNASLSWYDIQSKEVSQDVFFNANGFPLGDVAQSISLRDSLAYVVMNNSGKINVFHKETFEFAGKITGLTSPRHIHFLDDTRAYVTDLYARSIAIVNLQTMEVTGSIAVRNDESDFYQHSTEQMVQFGKFVFVNCWSYDNNVLVIDTETDQWIDTIEVLIQPVSMVLDKHNKLWVLSDGGFAGNPYGYEKPGLMRIDAQSREVEEVYRFPKESQPTMLAINDTADTLYYVNGHVYRHPVASEQAPELFVQSPYDDLASGGFRAIGIDPVSSEVYVSDAIDHVQPGLVYRFLPDASPVDTLRVGIIPGYFGFSD